MYIFGNSFWEGIKPTGYGRAVQAEMMTSLGQHILADLFGCPADALNSLEFVKKAMEKAAAEAGANVVESFFHPFQPQGVSGVIIIQESHLSIHTWPEYGCAAVDIFMCGSEGNPELALESLRRSFKASEEHIQRIPRLDLHKERLYCRIESSHCLGG